MKKIKAKLNLHEKSGQIIKLGRIEECDLLEDRAKTVLVRLPNGNVIERKKPLKLFRSNMDERIIKAIGFASDNCAYTKETRDSLNRMLMRYISSLTPWSHEWYEKALRFHDRINDIRTARGVSEKKMTPEKLEEITSGMSLS